MLPFLRFFIRPTARELAVEERADQGTPEGGNVPSGPESSTRENICTYTDAPTGGGGCSMLEEVPEEVALHILSFLSARDLGQLAQTCKYYNRLSEEKELWKGLYFSISKRQPPAQLVHVSWKWLYLSRLRTDYGNKPVVTSYRPAQFIQVHNEKLAASGNEDHLVADFAELNRGLGGIGCLGVYAETDVLIGGTMRGKMLAIDLATGELLRCIPAHKNTLSCLSVNQNLAVTGSWDTTLKVWDLDTYAHLSTLSRQGEIGYIRCCQVNKSRSLVASGSNDNSVKIWELETGQHLDTLKGHEGAVTGLSFHQDRLVSGSWDRTIRLWSFKSNEPVMVLRDTAGDKYCSIRYDPEQEIVYGGREDQYVAVFDLRAGKFMSRLKGHDSWVYGLALDDTTLFSGSLDGNIRVWDREHHECYNELSAGSCVHALLIHDSILYSANEDSTIRVLDFSGPLGRPSGRGRGPGAGPHRHF